MSNPATDYDIIIQPTPITSSMISGNTLSYMLFVKYSFLEPIWNTGSFPDKIDR